MYYEPDNLKEIKAEERAYRTWEYKVKNWILSMANGERKQRLWAKYFPPRTEPDDSYIKTNSVW
jgi:hypothetical protein